MKTVKKILVVDDERNVCDSLTRVLGKKGYKAESAYDATEALAKIDETPYHLVLLDIMMPGINGIELLKNIRSQYRECNVVMITGYASIDTAVETTRLGALNYISKPFTPDELLKVVENVLKEKPRAESFCDKGRIDCKKHVKSGPCKDECPIKANAAKSSESSGTALPGKGTKIDVDMPFEYDEVERATSSDYAQLLSRSDIPIVGWKKYYKTNNGVLVVDDEMVVCNSVRKILAKKNYDVEYAGTVGSALDMLRQRRYALVLLDLKLPDVSGMYLLKKIKEEWPEIEVIVITGYASLDSAVEAIKLGAINYITKPFTPEEIYKATDYAMVWQAA